MMFWIPLMKGHRIPQLGLTFVESRE